MKFNVELENKIPTEELTLSEFGVVKILEEANNQGFNDLGVEYTNLNIKDFANGLEVLKDMGLINFSKKDEGIFINDIFEAPKPEFEIDPRMLEVFKISTIQYESLLSSEDSQEKIIYTIFQRYPKDLGKKGFQINDANEYKEYIKNVSPLEVLQINNKVLTINDFTKLYEYLNSYDFNTDVLSFVYDYAIITSIYRNVNYEFINKVFMSLANNDIQSFEEAYDFIIKTKEKVEEQYTKYVEPDYDSVNSDDKKTKEDTEVEEDTEIEELFEIEKTEDLDELFGEIDFE